MSSSYEIEIKSLLGEKAKADSLREKILKSPLGFKLSSQHKQLNHYFNQPEDLSVLTKAVSPLVPEGKREIFERIISAGGDVSIRTRDADGKIIFVIKASIGDDTSANGISRLELEFETSFKNIEELDSLLLEAGLTYQAKWSREREEYKSVDTSVCIDKNAGYGYLAEFEKVLTDSDGADKAKKELLALMREVGAEELAQDRLGRMFDYYNSHWQDYYGTDKVFNIE
jgi:predicted adenylyl cyclase CyaB